MELHGTVLDSNCYSFASSNCFSSECYFSAMDSIDIAEHRKARLIALAQKHGGNAALGRKLEFRDGAYIGQMIRGVRPITEKFIEAAEKLQGCAGWFSPPNYEAISKMALARSVGENSTPAWGVANQTPTDAINANDARNKPVPVVGKGQGGLPERIWTDGDHPVGCTDEYGDVNTSDPHAFLVLVNGNSMYPKFEAQNYVLVEPGTEPELEDCVLVRLRTGETLIKRLLSRRNGYKLGSFSTPEVLEYSPEEVSWVYYIAHEVPRRKIKSRH